MLYRWTGPGKVRWKSQNIPMLHEEDFSCEHLQQPWLLYFLLAHSNRSSTAQKQFMKATPQCSNGPLAASMHHFIAL
jgi:hypothetical protein